jgi:alpha-tubulin suppressor-like RCC1 family protein
MMSMSRWSASSAAAVLVSALLVGVVSTANPAAANSLPVVSAGASHTCALMPSGQVLCWGDNTYGQLGTGTNTSSTVPVPVVGLPPVMQLSAGEFHTCAIDFAGQAWCWGNDENGSLGNGSNTNSSVPVAVSGSRVFTQLAAGGTIYGKTPTHADFTCGVTQTGNIWCWGYGLDGQLGAGVNASSNVPVQVLRPTAKAEQVATGANHACALLVDNSVWCWGFNAQGELGNNTKTSSNVPVQAIGVGGVQEVGAGVYNSCALLGSGGVLCWGVNTRGELGNGTTTNSKTAVPVIGLDGPAGEISTGGHHTCAIVNATGTQEIECWGEGQAGELGNGSYVVGPNPTPGPVFGMSGSPASGTGVLPEQVAAGSSTDTCAVVLTGQVFCFGSNAKGQLGDGTKVDRALPTLVMGITSGPQQIGEGSNGGCAVNPAQAVSCWGSIDGNDFAPHNTAQAVTSLTTGIAQVAVGDADACALLTTAKLRCWGENGSGEVGNNTTNPQATPVGGMGSGIGGVAGGDEMTCSYTSVAPKHSLSCWGLNDHGQVGDGSTTDRHVPVSVPLLAVQMAPGGGDHSCAISTNTFAYCWGANHYGQLGDGTTNDDHSPGLVQGLPATPIQIAAGSAFNGTSDLGDFSCALLVTGDVYCWGFNGEGQIGNGSEDVNAHPTPTQVGLSGPAKQVVAGAYHACALLMSGSVQCWGSDFQGTLGDGGTVDEPTPVTVSGLNQVLQIANESALATCALRATSPQSVMCWGDNGQDELGDGVSGGSSNTPQPVQGL